MVALFGLTIASCSDEDLNTDPYNKSGVNLLAFGPCPTERTHEIRITGTNLNKVQKVLFPADETTSEAAVVRSEFNKSDNENIYLNIPDATVPGNIRLVAGGDTIVSEGIVTFDEPIEITSVAPVTGLNAGDIITIKGDYVYNVASVTFTAGVEVPAEEFVKASRREILVRVPLAAESGVITLTDGEEWTEVYKEPLEIISASVTGISATNVEFGQQLTITGVNLHTVESVMFPGGIMPEFTIAADNKSITTTVPADTKSGEIMLMLYNGKTISTASIAVPTLAVTSISQSEELMVGDAVTIQGENFDRIVSVTLPGIGEFKDYTISGNSLTFNVPEGMTSGKIELKQNANIAVSIDVKMRKMGNSTIIWKGSFNCMNWAGNQELAWGGYDWSQVAPGTEMIMKATVNNPLEGWGCISLRHGADWGNLPAPVPGQYDFNVNEADIELSVSLTEDILNDLVANGGLVVTGHNFTLYQVELVEQNAATVIFEGQIGIGALGGADWGATAIDNGFAWGDVKAGQTLSISALRDPDTTDYNNFKIMDPWWSFQSDGLFFTAEGIEDNESTTRLEEKTFELVLTDFMIECFRDHGGLCAAGHGVIVTKVTVE